MSPDDADYRVMKERMDGHERGCGFFRVVVYGAFFLGLSVVGIVYHALDVLRDDIRSVRQEESELYGKQQVLIEAIKEINKRQLEITEFVRDEVSEMRRQQKR